MLYACQDSACVFGVCATPLVLVSLHVQGEVVGSGEGARADGALEGFGARVLSEMARQLIRTCEAPVAAVPRAPVRLLTCRTGGKERVSAAVVTEKETGHKTAFLKIGRSPL